LQGCSGGAALTPSLLCSLLPSHHWTPPSCGDVLRAGMRPITRTQSGTIPGKGKGRRGAEDLGISSNPEPALQQSNMPAAAQMAGLSGVSVGELAQLARAALAQDLFAAGGAPGGAPGAAAAAAPNSIIQGAGVQYAENGFADPSALSSLLFGGGGMTLPEDANLSGKALSSQFRCVGSKGMVQQHAHQHPHQHPQQHPQQHPPPCAAAVDRVHRYACTGVYCILYTFV
jgi:hypothetical protein